MVTQQPDTRPSNHGLSVSMASLLFVICFIWGANTVSIKFSNQGVPPLITASLRSLVSGMLVWGYARWRGYSVAIPREQRRYAFVLGLLFGLEFMFLYGGLAFTPASRSLIFLYTHPFWVALGAHFFLKDDRLSRPKIIGLLLAFAGIVAVFRAHSPDLPPYYWVGDCMELIAAIFWAATTLYVKHVSDKIRLDHYQTLFAQLLWAFPILALGALLFEFPAEIRLTPVVIGALVFQYIVVAFLSYLVWFWMIRHHAVSRLAAFTFLAPLFGVILGGLLLHEPLTPLIWVGLACVATGVYVVNR